MQKWIPGWVGAGVGVAGRYLQAGPRQPLSFAVHDLLLLSNYSHVQLRSANLLLNPLTPFWGWFGGGVVVVNLSIQTKNSHTSSALLKQKTIKQSTHPNKIKEETKCAYDEVKINNSNIFVKESIYLCIYITQGTISLRPAAVGPQHICK